MTYRYIALDPISGTQIAVGDSIGEVKREVAGLEKTEIMSGIATPVFKVTMAGGRVKLEKVDEIE